MEKDEGLKAAKGTNKRKFHGKLRVVGRGENGRGNASVFLSAGQITSLLCPLFSHYKEVIGGERQGKGIDG